MEDSPTMLPDVLIAHTFTHQPEDGAGSLGPTQLSAQFCPEKGDLTDPRWGGGATWFTYSY